jgi:hypothetical protein
MTKQSRALLLDEPSDVDLLSFDAVAGTVVEALLDPDLDPIALGLSGSWGSGKTSVLRIIGARLRDTGGSSTIVIETDPWRYDPQLGIKESLIGEILAAIDAALPEEGAGSKAKAAIKKMAKRIDWGKAMRLAANSAITVSLPSLDDVFELVRPKSDDKPQPITDMNQFRAEFARLLASEDLAGIQNVVVLVDDLDRCLPETVVETLETIRLFLAVPKMSFVIAADEERVADSIATRYPGGAEETLGEESPARLYLHKIVQTSVPVPSLSDFDTEAYLVMLQIRPMVEGVEFAQIVASVSDARRAGTPLEEVTLLQQAEFTEARNEAARIKPIVHEKTKGNPRRIKRFVNDLSVRLGIAERRGITLDSATIAKLMVLEQYFEDEFKTVTGWLREQTLRTNLVALERQAGTTPPADDDERSGDQEPAPEPDEPKKASPRKLAVTQAPAVEAPQQFPPGLIRWARLSPSLADKDIAPYLVFAASFRNVYLATGGLPEAIRDIATQLLSRSPAENRRVTDAMLQSLQPSETSRLAGYIGGVMVDEPQRQAAGVRALIRIARAVPTAVDAAVGALGRINPADLKVAGLVNLRSTDPVPVLDQLETLAGASGNDEAKRAVALARTGA